MLLLIILLPVAGMWVEMQIVTKIPVLGRYLEKYRILSLVFSLILSVELGALFGAAGLIVFAAGILSTVMIQPWYVMRANGTMAKMQQSYDSHRKEVMYRLNQFGQLALLIGRVILLPFVILFKIMDGLQHLSDRATRGARNNG